jgi:hypothetical protein
LAAATRLLVFVSGYQGNDDESLLTVAPESDFAVLVLESPNDLNLDVWGRYVEFRWHDSHFFPVSETSRSILISSLTCAWDGDPARIWSLSLVGANLLDGRSPGVRAGSLHFPVEVERSLYGQLKWSF